MTLHFWRNLTWLFEEMKIQTNMRNDGGIYRRESTRSTTRHPCSRTLKSSMTGSKMESLLSYIGCWIRVRDDDRWMQMEISAFFFFFFPFSSFSFMEKSLWDDTDRDGTTLISLVEEGCLTGCFCFCFVDERKERKCYEVRYDLLISWVEKGSNFSS